MSDVTVQKLQKVYDFLVSDDGARVRCMRFTVFSKEQLSSFTSALTGSGCFWTSLADPDQTRGIGILVNGTRDQLRIVLERLLGN